TGCELRGIIEENEIEPSQRLRYGAIVNPLAHDRREALAQGCSVRDFLERHLRLHGIRRESEHDGIGAANKRFNSLPPIFERIDFLTIDQHLKVSRIQRGFELIRKRHVLAGVRDEDLRLHLFAARFNRIGRHRNAPRPAPETLANAETDWELSSS